MVKRKQRFTNYINFIITGGTIMDNNMNEQQMMNQQMVNDQMQQQQMMVNQMQNDQMMQQAQMFNQQMQQPYGQPQMYNQQMQQPYGQPQMYNQQMQQPYGQPQMYNQYGQPVKQGPTAVDKIKSKVGSVKGDFTNRSKQFGLSTWCLIGLIGAMLLIFAPFMNFASVHYSDKIEGVKISIADGFNMFELSKMSGTVDNVVDFVNDEMGSDIEKSDITDMIDDYEEDVVDEIEDETDVKIDEKPVKEVIGVAYLAVKGQVPLFVTPWLLIISGILLFVTTITKDKTMKIVFSAIPLVCLVWLILCSTNFFTMMGIGAWAMIIGSAAGITSAVKDV